MSADFTEALFAIWKKEKIIDELAQAGLLLSEIASASSVDFDEGVVQQYITENDLQPIPWVKDNDSVIKNLCKEDKTVKEICQELVVNPRSEIAVCIRASQLKLKWSGHQRHYSKVDGHTYMVGKNGGWTATGDSYVLKGFDDGFSEWEIWSHFFRNTRSEGAVSGRRRELVRQSAFTCIDASLTADAALMQPLTIALPDQIPEPPISAVEMYEQMMLLHTNLSVDNRHSILELIDRLDWPGGMQEDGEDETGSWTGSQSAWTSGADELLVALHGQYGLT